MEPRIERIGPNPLVPGQRSQRVHERTPEEREAFERKLAQGGDDAEDDQAADESRDVPELGTREPDEAGGTLDLLG